MRKGIRFSQRWFAPLVLFALSAFLMCALPPHAPHAEASPAANAAAVSASAPAAADDSGSAHSPGAAHGHDDHSGTGPVCHAVGGSHVAVPLAPSQSSQLELLGLLALALIVVAGLLRPGSSRPMPCWSTGPRRPLAGFPLLISLGVSRT